MVPKLSGKRLVPAICLSVLLLVQSPPPVAASHDDGPNGTLSVYTTVLPQRLWKTSAVSTPFGSFVFGGVNDAGATVDTIVRFESDPPSVSTLATRLPAPIHSTSAVWDGQYAYIFGGETAAGRASTILRFDPVAPAGSQLTTLPATLPTARSATSAVWDGSHAYILGGSDGALLPDILQFDPDAGSVSPLSFGLPQARSHTSAVWTGQYAVIFGGKDANGNPVRDIVRLDPSLGVSSVILGKDLLPVALHSTAAAWTGEKAVVLGGRNPTEASRKIYIYDPADGSIADTELDGRREAPSAVWKNGHVDLFGGRNNTAVSSWIQRYTPNPDSDGVTRMEYSLDANAIRSSFLHDGTFVLPVPQDGDLLVSATQSTLYEPGFGAYWEEMLPNGQSVLHPNPNIPVDGIVVGDPTSVVSLILGEHGVYGTITRDSDDGLLTKIFDFTPREDPAAHTFTQVVVLDVQPKGLGPALEAPEELNELHEGDHGLPDPPNLSPDLEPQSADSGSLPAGSAQDGASFDALDTLWPSEPLSEPAQPDSGGPAGSTEGGGDAVQTMSASTWPPSSGCLIRSYVQLYVEPSLMSKHSDWLARTESGFKAHHGSYAMWKDICLELLIKGYVKSTPVNVVTNDYDPLGNFQTWLKNSGRDKRLTGANAYQLWSGRDFKKSCDGDDSWCRFGVGYVDQARQSWTGFSNTTQSFASSVAEGHDCCWDYYDPDETRQRGLVGGHELTHVYGEPGHPTHCKSGGNCNIMREGVFVREKATYWTDKSRCEVYRWIAHRDATYNQVNGAWEPCPNWY